ncbi:MAG: glycoside hydrolase family 2 protein, partial [Burkholderiales bacterium]|nr:glycoside hydrolase family 2 protein [Burkholderiales bacterium]
CLAFAHVPDPCTTEAMGVPAVHHPAWKQGVPRDRHVSWDFEDTRDHYLQQVFGLDAALLRRTDPVRYLQASRAVTAHIVSCTLSQWRRPGSPTAGALVFTAGDLRLGAGWGLIDVLGEPKAAYHGFKQVAQPVALLLTDEGCDGVDVHLLNDTPAERQFEVSLRVLRQGRTVVASGQQTVQVPARGALTLSGTAVLGAFFDLTYAYRFGPPGHDEVVVTAVEVGGCACLQAVFFPHGPWVAPAQLALSAQPEQVDGHWHLVLRTDALARFVHIDDRSYLPGDNHFHLLPGQPRVVPLIPRNGTTAPPAGVVTALNALETSGYRGSA